MSLKGCGSSGTFCAWAKTIWPWLMMDPSCPAEKRTRHVSVLNMQLIFHLKLTRPTRHLALSHLAGGTFCAWAKTIWPWLMMDPSCPAEKRTRHVCINGISQILGGDERAPEFKPNHWPAATSLKSFCITG